MEPLKTFRIPDCNLPNLMERIDKLSKKAVKLVGQPITATVVRVEEVERSKHPGVFDIFHHVAIAGPVPKLAGWVFSAALDVVDLDGERAVMVRTAPGETIPSSLRGHTEGCGHCNKNRNRKTLFVLRREAP